MIDCENEVYTRVATELRTSFPGINITGEYLNTPSSFPHVSIIQSDNAVIRDRLDSSSNETDSCTFEINIYSNKSPGKKTECKAIARTIDSILFSMNFIRLAMTPVPNMEDASIYRIVARYRVATDGNFFYRR